MRKRTPKTTAMAAMAPVEIAFFDVDATGVGEDVLGAIDCDKPEVEDPEGVDVLDMRVAMLSKSPDFHLI